jgi:hypothetical protein
LICWPGFFWDFFFHLKNAKKICHGSKHGKGAEAGNMREHGMADGRFFIFVPFFFVFALTLGHAWR